ncbi:MAG: hypothetical protein JWQ48_2128, partial [Conexibacter sp.]|nr:hypothetical protein [Conexibacter sp.]
ARAAKTQNGSGTATLTIKLSAAARRQLDKDHKLGLRVTVSTPGAHSRVARFTLTSRGR